MDPITDNVSVEYDEGTEQWSSHYHGYDVPVASAGATREEAIAHLVDAVASFSGEIERERAAFEDAMDLDTDGVYQDE